MNDNFKRAIDTAQALDDTYWSQFPNTLASIKSRRLADHKDIIRIYCSLLIADAIREVASELRGDDK